MPNPPQPDRDVESPAPGRSLALSAALTEVAWVGDSLDGLMPELPLDAVMARASRGEMVESTQRLLELVIAGCEEVGAAAEAVATIGNASFDTHHRRAVLAVAEAWWIETLSLRPGEHHGVNDPSTVLGILVGLGEPMIRWLEPWLDRLDGPGTSHLASAILDGLTGPAWEGKADQAGQVLAWARSEPVVNGIVLIGATHLGDSALGDVLDRLI